MKRVLCVAMFAMFAFSAPALAGLNAGDYEVGFDYGTTDFDSNTGLDSGDHWAIRGGHFFNERFELEGQFADSSEESSIGGVAVDTTMRLIMVNGVFNFHPRPEIVPYVMVGLGMADLELESGGLSIDDDSVAYQIGAGSRFFFGKSKRAAFRMDVSLVREDTFNQSSTHTNITGGFTFRLGN